MEGSWSESVVLGLQGEQFKYNLYVSHRDWESLYIAYDEEKRRVIGRCEACELKVRTKGELP